MFARAVETYRKTSKPTDIFWNRRVARPLASVLLVPIAGTRVTPNQLTLLSLLVFLGTVAVWLTIPGHRGLLVGALVLELSYVLDCADGQLARLRGTSSPVGAHLDFLMDELKAFLLVGAVAVRTWQGTADVRYLVEGLVGLVAVAAAISLTTFVRRPEYVQATGAKPPPSAGDYGGGFEDKSTPRTRPLPIRLVEGLGRYLVHYPSYIVFVAAANRLDVFLHVYVAVNAAHAARTFLALALKLGRPAPASS